VIGMADVFVSYSRSDKARVAPIVAALEAQGWSVWWDPAIAPGQQFDRMIADELERARAVLVVWTPDSVESRWVRGEAREGADRGILVPVQLGSARLPIDFRAYHTTDLGEPGDAASNPQFQDVLRAIEALVGRAPRSVAAMPAPAAAGTAPASGPSRITICVLPLANLGGDPEQQYFSDGITADIITELSRWRLLAVRSRSASFKYRGPGVDPAQVARELNVRFVVEGTVRRMGDRVRIGVQLIDAETGNQVWGERFDRAQAEIFSVQDEVVQTIVGTLVGRVHVSDAERSRRKPPASLDAYECVLQGNAHFWDDPAGAAEARRLFERAIEIDPKYGLAHALLATLTRQKWRDDDSANSDALLDEAYRLAMRAVELDDGDSTCHSLLAQVCLYRRSFDLALEHMQRSMALNPNNQWNAADMGLILVYLGRADEALAWNQRARQIDPYFDQPWYWRQSGLTCMVLGRYEEALKLFARHPVRKHYIAAYMAGCHARLGDLESARARVAECLSLRPGFSVRHWMAKEPFKIEAEAARIAESLHLAGLPG
jgi:TolB-like protein